MWSRAKSRSLPLGRAAVAATLTIAQAKGRIQEDKLQEEVERLYQVSARLISLLEHVVERTAYNPTETAGIYKFYAEFFWEAVRGEGAEGHPRYRPMPQPLQGAVP
jgi:hypothetical protein